jgi:thiol-disulfide isomerase/thioredoxin
MLKRVLLGISLLLCVASASAFTLTDSKGGVHSSASYKGKWVLVNFWATWCPPCLEEIPDLIALHEKYRKTKLEVIGIAMDYQDPKQVLSFADSMFISYPIVLGDAKIAAQFGRLQGLPTSYLYNPEGKLVAYQVGALTKKSVEDYINRKAANKK